MARWSFGLRQLFLWTAAIALGLVALRSASTLWVAAMTGLALVVLAASILLIVFRRGQQRAYWIGFATFGWLYILLLAIGMWPVEANSNVDTPFRAHNFVTEQLASASYHWLYDEAFEKYFASSNMYGGGMMGGMGGTPMMSAGMPMGSTGMGMRGMAPPPGPPPGPNENDFVNVAHALWTVLFAAIGGCLAYWLYKTGPGRSDSSASASL